MPFQMPGKKRVLGGTTGPASPGAPTPGGGAAAPGQQSSPGYVNFSRLLAVNQGGAHKMADKLAGGVQQQGQQVSNTLEATKTDFSRKTADSTKNYQAPEYHWDGKESASAALYRTAGAAKAQADKGFTGAKDWNEAGYETQALASQAKKAEADAKSLTTAGGRGSLLRRDVSGPYGAGMSSMDAALSGAALGGRGAELASLYGGLSQRLIDYQQQGQEGVAKATATSNETAAKYGADAEKYTGWAERQAAEEESSKRRREEYLAAYPRLREYPGAPAREHIVWIDGKPVDTDHLIPGLYG